MGIQSIDMDRRGFLRASAVAGAAISIPLLLAGCSTGTGSGGGSGSKRLRIGVQGGGTSETLDFNHVLGESDIARTSQIFEGLTYFDVDGGVKNRLAESLEPNKDGSVWTVVLKKGVTFHDGSPFTADSVLASFAYILDPANSADGASVIDEIDLANSKKIDDTTVELHLIRPNFLLPNLLGERMILMMPAGTPNWKKPVGTGPFAFGTFALGDRSLFPRFKDYHGTAPLIEELEIISIDDATARLNALKSGTVDAIAQVAPEMVKTAGATFTLLSADSGTFPAIYTRLAQTPFTDPRVTQALRLAADRQQLIDNVLFGAGSLGNDLASPFDPYYASDLPQRKHDPDKAKFLLKQAGYDRLPLTLHTADHALGAVQSATLFASQAKDAGFDITLSKTPVSEYYDKVWLKESFATTNWGGRPLISWMKQAVLPGAAYPETDWNRPDFTQLVESAVANPNDADRKRLFHDAQEMLYNDGGYLVWGFLKNIDATSKRVSGITASAIRPLGNYDFRTAKVG
jgi:peptide/nickel transport system substrate-binding protein